jgi:hypothetical protein
MLRAITNEPARKARQISGQALGYSIREILLLSVTANVRKGQHNDRHRGWGRNLLSTGLCVHALSVMDHCKGTYGTSDNPNWLLLLHG